MKTTRLGKVVGSVKTDPNGWCYWVDTDRGGFDIVAPSGAKMGWASTAAEARREVARENAKWFAA